MIETFSYDDRLRSFMELRILISGSSSKHHHSMDQVYHLLLLSDGWIVLVLQCTVF